MTVDRDDISADVTRYTYRSESAVVNLLSVVLLANAVSHAVLIVLWWAAQSGTALQIDWLGRIANSVADGSFLLSTRMTMIQDH